MGCFSFLCNSCGKPIKSSSFRGERCYLFLLKDGHLIDVMNGEYDSYGRVFDEKGESIFWRMSWSDVCDLMFTDNPRNGIAAYHENCCDKMIPKTRSFDDPDQGWGGFTFPKAKFKVC